MFLNEPKLINTGKKVRGRVVYRLAEPLIFETRMNGGVGEWKCPCCGVRVGHGIRVVVPADFTSDLASAPWWLWWIFPPSGPWDRAAILHDYLYGIEGVSRFLADALMREAMAQLDVSMLRRVVAYYCLRLFGRGHYAPGASSERAKDG